MMQTILERCNRKQYKCWVLAFLFLVVVQDDAKKLESIIKEATAKSQKAYVFVEGGSGVIVSGDGYFFTNHHVAGGKKTIKIHLIDGSLYTAKKIATDPYGDLTLFKIESDKKFDYLELGDSNKLEVGQYCIAIGNPFLLGTVGGPDGKLYPSISVGIVSAIHRYQGTYFDCIQTDAALNPGNSGGPLITLDCKVVGINGRIAPRFPARIFTGVGYAIPSNRVKRFMKAMMQVRDGGEVLHGQIGGLLISSDHTDGRGAKIREVKEGSSAAKAGFKADDLILKIDDQSITSSYRYWSVVGTYPMDDEITVTVERKKEGDEKEILKIKVKLDRPEIAIDPRPKGAGYMGIQVDDAEEGVKITKLTPGSPADDAGIQEGDIILKFEGKKPANAKEFLDALWKKKPGDTVKLTLKRGDTEYDASIILVKHPQD